MKRPNQSILVVGFNTRPLAYSLYRAGLEVFAVDFFGDLDLFPYVKDCIIITKELDMRYEQIKEDYKSYLAKYTIDLLRKYPNINYLLIGSGLDDALKEREMVLDYILKNNYQIINLNNDLEVIRQARDIRSIYQSLESEDFKIPYTKPLIDFKKNQLDISYPIILKKKSSSGGTNVYKINRIEEFELQFNLINERDSIEDWLIQEYIDGIPISCTVIANGKENQIISINRQIIGLKILNPPKDFIYCGNVVPSNLSNQDIVKISKLSSYLARSLGLKGINGFDFVLRDHEPFLMEINPRIPGSIRASEESLNLNLLFLHIESFNYSKWNEIIEKLKNNKNQLFTTKLIIFAPDDINIAKIKKINKIENVHDKTPPNEKIKKDQPICTILYKDQNYKKSYFGALKIADKVFQIIE
ncbi:MAG: ATP-grasp domain-containing protein [Promethearchaeati archaeon]